MTQKAMTVTANWTLPCRCGEPFPISPSQRPLAPYAPHTTFCPHCRTAYGFYLRPDGSLFSYLVSEARLWLIRVAGTEVEEFAATEEEAYRRHETQIALVPDETCILCRQCVPTWQGWEEMRRYIPGEE